jgi:hypothetical protein
MHADACGQLRRADAGTRSILIHMSDIVQKLWGFCHTLRHDGIDYGDYIEQITYLLFIKMADERSVVLPDSCDWKTLGSNPRNRLSFPFSPTPAHPESDRQFNRVLLAHFSEPYLYRIQPNGAQYEVFRK